MLVQQRLPGEGRGRTEKTGAQAAEAGRVHRGGQTRSEATADVEAGAARHIGVPAPLLALLRSWTRSHLDPQFHHL